jgi:hypothetical protein
MKVMGIRPIELGLVWLPFGGLMTSREPNLFASGGRIQRLGAQTDFTEVVIGVIMTVFGYLLSVGVD